MPSGDAAPGARTVISAALCYYATGRAGAGGGAAAALHLERPLCRAPREARRARPAARRRVPRARRREPARRPRGRRRSGVGFYGKNTMTITRRHGSWVVLGTLVTDVEVEPSPPLDAGCGSCTLCIEACPTGALDEPGTLDATRCLSYWSQAPAPIRRSIAPSSATPCTAATSARTSAPGTAASRAPRRRRLGPEPSPRSTSSSGSRPTARPRRRYDRLYVPRNDPRWLRRNALVALGNTGGPEHRAVLERYAEADDELLSEHARWALERIEARR